MSDRPLVPTVPDVFSSPSPSPSPNSSHRASPDSVSPSLVPVSQAWFPAGASDLGDALPLEALDPRDCAHEGDSTYASEARDAFPSFAPHPRPATPPLAPVVAHRLDCRSLAPPVVEEAPFHTLSKLSGREYTSFSSVLSPVSPSFNPVVGSSSGTTPTRQTQPFTSVFRFDQPLKSASDSATPLRFSAFEQGSLALGRVHPTVAPAAWTWPTRSNKADEEPSLRYREPSIAPSYDLTPPRGVDEDTPTKVGRLAACSLVDSPPKQPSSSSAVATRYVLVEGLRKDLTEADLRELLLPRCAGLSMRGCFTARLRDHGEVVLLFHDVRHALAASRLVQLNETGMIALQARCITREAFVQLAGPLQASTLLSPSEAVLVFTLRGPPSSQSFTPVSLLAEFGELRALKVVEEHLHVVEYWDDRAAEQAHKVLDGREQAGAKFECSFEPGVASTEPPSWTKSTTASTSKSTLVPLDPFFPPTPAATPRSTTSFETSFLSPPQPPPLPTFNFAQSIFPQPPASSAPRWTSSLPPVAPTGLLHFAPAPQQQPTFVVPAQPAISTSVFEQARAAALAPAPAPANASSASPWPAKHRSHIGQEYGIVRDDRIPAGNVLNFERIERGLDVRTTVMIKNIPNKLKDYEVMAFIEEVVGRAYDFIYIRCDYSTGNNVGYGFCNFTSTDALLAFAKARLGTRWNLCGSDKLCVLSYANIQGKASLVNHFRNSSVLDQAESRRPKLFVTSGPRQGEPEPFPVCDDPVRKARSALNASTVGLFPAQKPVFKLAQAFQGLNTASS